MADSQEKSQDDVVLKGLSKQSPPPKKDGTKQDFILVTSSGGPSEPARHVSSSFNLFIEYQPLVALEGESKCLHLGLPSNPSYRFLFLLLLV
jgi:hypothetical protein